MTVFVDALDETGPESTIYLANYFHRLLGRAGKQGAAVRICISCRHYPIIGSTRAMEIWVEEHNGRDIAAYVQDTLAETEMEMEAIGTPSEGSRQMLIANLIQQANCVFRWARLIIPHTRRRLDEEQSFQTIYNWLRKIPPDLEDVYQYILTHVIEVWNLKESLQLFQWLCLAERPLTVVELRYAMAAGNAEISNFQMPMEHVPGFIQSDKLMKLKIKVLSAGLAEVVSNGDSNETAQVVHQSVTDFLRKRGLAVLSNLLGTRSLPLKAKAEETELQSQAILYRSCLTYLAAHRLREEMPPEDTERAINNKALRDDLNRSHPFLFYATLNIFIHGRQAADRRVSIMPNEKDVLKQVETHFVSLHRITYPRRPTHPARGTRVIHIAAAANLVDLLRDFSLGDKELATKDQDRNTALHIAARYGHIKAGTILRKALGAANCESRNMTGRTPLAEAARFRQIKFVEWLLHEGAQLESTIGKGRSALQEASLRGYRDIVEMLLSAGAEVNEKGDFLGNSLESACAYGNIATVKMLLNAGANVNAQNDQGRTALHLAVDSYPHAQRHMIVQIIIDAGADVNAHSGEHGTVLQAAAVESETSSGDLQILIDAGANVNAQSDRFCTALQAAVSGYGDRSELVQLLLDAGADVNCQGGELGNALQAAAHRPAIKALKMLLEAGANVNAEGGLYGTALQAAAYEGSSEIVRMLLNAGADVNARGGKSGNALHAAAYQGSSEVVQMLLKAGADVNTQGGESGNALQAAAYEGSIEVFQILLDAGADINAQGGLHGSALQAAEREGASKILQILLHAGADCQCSRRKI